MKSLQRIKKTKNNMLTTRYLSSENVKMMTKTKKIKKRVVINKIFAKNIVLSIYIMQKTFEMSMHNVCVCLFICLIHTSFRFHVKTCEEYLKWFFTSFVHDKNKKMMIIHFKSLKTIFLNDFRFTSLKTIFLINIHLSFHIHFNALFLIYIYFVAFESSNDLCKL
jgi:hypothetical protein